MSDTKTKWESIVSGDALIKAKALRSKTFIELKERSSALPEFLELCQVNLDPSNIPQDITFLWAGFTLSS